MAIYTTAQDCLNAGLHWAGELETTDATASEFRAKGLDYLNRAYLAILSGSSEFDVDLNESWTWGKSSNPGIFTLQPLISNSATLTAGSTSGTFATAPVNSLGAQVSVLGRYLKVDGQPDYMLITAHTLGGTSFTIDEAWTGDTVTANSCKLYQLDYATVASCLRLIAPMRIYRYQGNPSIVGAQSGGEILGSDYAAMLRDYPLYALSTYIPNRFSVKFYDTTTNTFTIRFNSDAPFLSRVEYDYIPYPAALTDSTGSLPIIPLTHRVVLAYAVAYFLCLDKNDDRASAYLQSIQATLKSMKRADETQRQSVNPFRGRLIPRRDLTKRYRFWAGY